MEIIAGDGCNFAFKSTAVSLQRVKIAGSCCATAARRTWRAQSLARRRQRGRGSTSWQSHSQVRQHGKCFRLVSLVFCLTKLPGIMSAFLQLLDRKLDERKKQVRAAIIFCCVIAVVQVVQPAAVASTVEKSPGPGQGIDRAAGISLPPLATRSRILVDTTSVIRLPSVSCPMSTSPPACRSSGNRVPRAKQLVRAKDGQTADRHSSLSTVSLQCSL